MSKLNVNDELFDVDLQEVTMVVTQSKVAKGRPAMVRRSSSSITSEARTRCGGSSRWATGTTPS